MSRLNQARCHNVDDRSHLAYEKYKGQRDAAERLTAIVLHGSGLGPGDRHWQRKASGVAMLPNAVEINEADARKLVRWILSLAPSWSDPEGHR